MSKPGPAALALLERASWLDVWRGAFIQWLIFVPLLSLLFAAALIPANATSGMMVAILSPFYSAPVGAVVTFGLGAPLAKLLAWALARNTTWVAHLAAFLGLGFALATLIIHLYMLSTGSLWDSAAWWASLPTFLPIASAAALSVGAGWSLSWRCAALRERTAHHLLPLLAD